MEGFPLYTYIYKLHLHTFFELEHRKKKAEKKFIFIDLFAGCGGLMEFSL